MTAPENWLRTGRSNSLQIVIFEPFFEEVNRTRRLLAQVMRQLDTLEIGATLPDLPGTGESTLDLADVSFADWRDAARRIIALVRPDVIVSLRGGALLDDVEPATPVWRFSPETGARIVRDLRRTSLAGETGLYAGHRLSDPFLRALEAASPAAVAQLRTIRLESDAGGADAKITGSPLWRRAEPGEDSAMAAAMTADLSQWIRQCAAS